MPVYTIYLSSNNGNTSSFNLSQNQEIIPIEFGNVEGSFKIWEIDWDKIFKGDNYKYKKCRVKSNLQSKGIVYSTGINDGEGYLTFTNPTIYNATTTVNGLPLCLTQFYNTPTVNDYTSNIVYCFLNNKLDSQVGINICNPIGRGRVNFNLNDGTSIYRLNQPPPNKYQYQLFLSFEFYN